MANKRRADTKETVKSLYNYDWYQRNKDKQRWYQLKIKYGISEEEYNKLLITQDFSCAICSKHVSKCSQALYVDHRHTTGRIRGLLCAGCNSGIGLMDEDLEILDKAMLYLKKVIK